MNFLKFARTLRVKLYISFDDSLHLYFYCELLEISIYLRYSLYRTFSCINERSKAKAFYILVSLKTLLPLSMIIVESIYFILLQKGFNLITFIGHLMYSTYTFNRPPLPNFNILPEKFRIVKFINIIDYLHTIQDRMPIMFFINKNKLFTT